MECSRRCKRFFSGTFKRLAMLMVVGAALANYVTGQATAADRSGTQSMACAAPTGTGSFDIGFTMTHARLQPAAAATCLRDHGATLSGDQNIVRNYQNDKIRQEVLTSIRAMAANGARAARLIFWYRHAEDEQMARAAAGHDVLGYVEARGGRLPDRIIENLKTLVRDVAAAGYRRIYVNVAPMGRSNPRTSHVDCTSDAPNCFAPAYLPLNWAVARQIIESLREPGAPKLDIVFDLASESCFVAASPAPIENALAQTVTYMVEHYAKTFGSGGFVVSCPAAREPRALAGLQSIASLYRRLNIRPAAIDIHLYDTNPAEAERILLAAANASDALSVPLDIAETFANSEPILSVISRLVQQGGLPNLRTVMMFPRTTESACEEDVSVPYDIAWFAAKLGKSTAMGNSDRSCVTP